MGFLANTIKLQSPHESKGPQVMTPQAQWVINAQLEQKEYQYIYIALLHLLQFCSYSCVLTC